MSLMFSFIFGDVHGHVFLGFYWCVWLLISWALLVFVIIVLLNSIGVHGRTFLGCFWSLFKLSFVGVLGHCFFGLLMFMIILS
jgi:hypothetical protein